MAKLPKVFTPLVDISSDHSILPGVGTVFQKIQELLQQGKVTFDFNGHLRSRKTKPTFTKNYSYEFRRDFGREEKLRDYLATAGYFQVSKEEQLQNLKKVIDHPGEMWVELTDLDRLGYCRECGKNLRYKFNGETIKVIGRCKYPKGCPPIKIQIPVPSGIMVFANYFDGLDECAVSDRDGYLENLQEINHYAGQGVAQVYCGNSCPGVYFNDGTLLIGNSGHRDYEVCDPMPGNKVGGITTDLWAWSMTCRDNYKKLHLKGEAFRVKVRPGVYEVTDYFYSKGGYGSPEKADIFATIQLV